MAKGIRGNNEFFEVLVADIFARLYTMFPEPVDLDSNLPYEKFDIDEAPERLERLWVATLQWLAEEGYIRFRHQTDAGHTVFHDTVLTAQGLQALKKVPSTLEGDTTYGDRLASAAKDLGSEAAKKTVGEVVGQVLGWLARSMIG